MLRSLGCFSLPFVLVGASACDDEHRDAVHDQPAAARSDEDASEARPEDDQDAGDADAAIDSAAPKIGACVLTVQGSQYIGEGSCGVRINGSFEASPIYQSLAALEGGIVDSYEHCLDHRFAWYPVGSSLIACPDACERIDRLYPTFVSAVKPLIGCDGPRFERPMCALSEAEYASVSDVSCRLPIKRPEDPDVAYLAASIRQLKVVASHDDCAAEPLAVYPDDAKDPTQLIACEGACALSKGLFPAFVSATRTLFLCDTSVH